MQIQVLIAKAKAEVEVAEVAEVAEGGFNTGSNIEVAKLLVFNEEIEKS